MRQEAKEEEGGEAKIERARVAHQTQTLHLDKRWKLFQQDQGGCGNRTAMPTLVGLRRSAQDGRIYTRQLEHAENWVGLCSAWETVSFQVIINVH